MFFEGLHLNLDTHTGQGIVQKLVSCGESGLSACSRASSCFCFVLLHKKKLHYCAVLREGGKRKKRVDWMSVPSSDLFSCRRLIAPIIKRVQPLFSSAVPVCTQKKL